MIRVLVADDQPVVRSGLRALLERSTDIEVAAEVSDGSQAVAAARRHRPDVVLMDIRMPQVDGITATRTIREELPPGIARVLMLTTFPEERNVLAAIRAGAAGFLVKDSTPDELRTAIRAVAAGDALLSPEVTATVLQQIHVAPTIDGALTARVSALSPRERDLLVEIGHGRSNDEIASRLFLSPATVRTYVSRLLTRLDVRDRAGLVVIAYEAGVVRPGR